MSKSDVWGNKEDITKNEPKNSTMDEFDVIQWLTN